MTISFHSQQIKAFHLLIQHLLLQLLTAPGKAVHVNIN